MPSFQVTIDSQTAEETITRMIEKLKVVPVPAELTAWQAEDMRRRYPNTEINNPTSAMTMIYPRSRQAAWVKPKRSLVRPSWLKKPVLRGPIVRVKSNRPILRPELFVRLRERMNEMLVRELQW